MGIGKSFGISFLIYIVLNFLMNMLMVVSAAVVPVMDWFMTVTTDTFGFLSTLFVIGSLGPSGTAILGGLGTGITMLTTPGENIFLGIMLICAPIFPGLIAAIVAGKMAENSKQAFGGWMLTAVIASGVLIAFSFIDPNFVTTSGVFTYVILLAGGTPSPLELVIYTLLLGLLSGLFWSGLAAISGAED